MTCWMSVARCIIIRVEIPGETLCPDILLVQTSGLGLVCYKLKIHLQKATTTKWKTRGGRHQHKLATKCHVQGFFFIFIIQHVIYTFVAGHFVATKLVSQLSAGKSFCSYVRVARVDVVRMPLIFLIAAFKNRLSVISCFVAGHFVAIQSVFQLSEGISHGLLLDDLPPSETTKCFPGPKKHIATKCFMLSRVIQKRQLQNCCTA